MNAQQMSIDNIANNLANANTAGFKSRRTQFQDLLYQSFLQPGAAAGAQTVVPSGLQLGLGARPAANSIVFTQGNFQQTGNPLDLVIQGKGFFQIRRPTGPSPTRAPEIFNWTATATWSTAQRRSAGAADHDSAQAQSITIAQDGTVSYTQPGQTRGAGGRADSARQFHQSGRAEQHRQRSVPADRRERRSDHRQPRRTGGHWERCSRATSRPRTSAWWRSSSI